MTRKDYILIADALLSALNESDGREQRKGIDCAIVNLAWRLGKDNPRFDRERFLKASGHSGSQS